MGRYQALMLFLCKKVEIPPNRHMSRVLAHILLLTIFAPLLHAQDSLIRPAIESYETYRYLDSAYNDLYRSYQYLAADTSAITTEVERSVDDKILAARLNILDEQTPFELTYNSKIKAFINLYLNKKEEQTSRMIGMADYYFPLFETLLDRYELPLELKYLAVVESALNPVARSRAGAVGLWQFMYSTGKLYDLRVTSFTDERKDPVLATHAACRYLRDLYKMYDNWELALAAYNSGPGNVNRAIRYSGGKRTYWEIYPYLPRETRGYVPAFIAVNYVYNYYKEHGIKPTPFELKYHQVDTIHVHQRMTLKELATYVDEPTSRLAQLNPVLKGQTIPGSQAGFPVFLPMEKTQLLAAILDSVETHKAKVLAEQKPTYTYETVYHYVRRGDALSKIARRYGVSVTSLKQWNRLRGTTIRVGQRLAIQRRVKVYASAETSEKADKKEVAQPRKAATAVADNKPEKTPEYLYYTIQPGDTLWEIARKHQGVTVTQLKKMNSVYNVRRLKPGKKIIVGVKG